MEEALKAGAGWERMNEGGLTNSSKPSVRRERGWAVSSQRTAQEEGTALRNFPPASTPAHTQLLAETTCGTTQGAPFPPSMQTASRGGAHNLPVNGVLGGCTRGFPGGSNGKESACNAGDLGSIPGLGRFPWRRAWLPAPVFLPGESPWTEEPGG